MVYIGYRNISYDTSSTQNKNSVLLKALAYLWDKPEIRLGYSSLLNFAWTTSTTFPDSTFYYCVTMHYFAIQNKKNEWIKELFPISVSAITNNDDPDTMMWDQPANCHIVAALDKLL